MAESDELVLYHAPRSRSITAQWMLEELGRPFRLQVLNLQRREHKQPDYLALNPMGKVPTLRHGEMVMTEAAAICCYLADTFPKAGLAVPVGDPRRGPYLKWLFFGPSCVEPALIDRLVGRGEPPNAAAGYGTFDNLLEVVSRAVPGEAWLLGETFTAADVVIGAQLIWGQLSGSLPERPEILAYTSRLRTRPALERVFAKDAELVAQQAA
jgi:glutathione S-transferase